MDDMIKKVLDSQIEALENLISGEGYEEGDCGDYDATDLTERLQWYFEDVLDVKFSIDARFNLLDVELTLGFGGPNIFYTVSTGQVNVYWNEYIHGFVNESAREAIDNFWAGEYEILRSCR